MLKQVNTAAICFDYAQGFASSDEFSKGKEKAGGFFMIPIIVCGIITTFIIIERCIYFINTKKRDDAIDYLYKKGRTVVEALKEPTDK